MFVVKDVWKELVDILIELGYCVRKRRVEFVIQEHDIENAIMRYQRLVQFRN